MGHCGVKQGPAEETKSWGLGVAAFKSMVSSAPSAAMEYFPPCHRGSAGEGQKAPAVLAWPAAHHAHIKPRGLHSGTVHELRPHSAS